MQKKLTLIKLGGSVITDKSQPETLRPDVLARLVGEVAAAQVVTDEVFIIGHGQGSFAHVPAKKYQTKQGFIGPESRIGMALTQDSALRCNRAVVSACVAAGLPAVTYLMSSALLTKAGAAESWSPAVLETLLKKQMLPITCGDVITDSEMGCTIWSTETILSFFAQHFSAHEVFALKRVIHVTDVDGVLDKNGVVIAEITPETFPQLESVLYAPQGSDVTGGMRHKILESLEQANSGAEVMIVSGLVPGRVQAALTRENCIGTTIKGA